MQKKDNNPIKVKIYRHELPTPYTIKQINLMFLLNAKRGVKSSTGELTVYHLYDRSYNQMKDYILNLPDELVTYIEKIMLNFPDNAPLYNQCAYYFRAFSRGQIFYDANHRTGYFSLATILKKKDIIINARLIEVAQLTEYIKAQGWLKQGEMNVNLNEKDDEYYALVKWFEIKLELR